MKMLTSKALKIKPSDRAGLIAALKLMESGKIIHTSNAGRPIDRVPSEPKQFNMGLWHSENECGTVCCIGGLAETLGAKGLRDFVTEELDDLFFPPNNRTSITVSQGVAALRNYLTTGKPSWGRVLA